MVREARVTSTGEPSGKECTLYKSWLCTQGLGFWPVWVYNVAYSVRPQTLQSPQYTASTATTLTTTASVISTEAAAATLVDLATSTTTECPPSVTTIAVSSGTLRPTNCHNNLLRKLASSHYQRELHHSPDFHSNTSPAVIELPLQEFKTSPTSGAKTRPNCISAVQEPPIYTPSENTEGLVKEEETRSPPPLSHKGIPSIPDPPPPPKTLPTPPCNQISTSTGILCQQGCPQTPGTMKNEYRYRRSQCDALCVQTCNLCS
ncbi:hypothetical protein Cfor_12419 [Coptotermes formosanus]|uniref:Uncharacterized protein n=1 Tax=Coptotermes formosanus TaxID=36987 RepID=A0A6L2Q6V3_COPFO|nr:hypothetical protein Cfor_12419 [Coptotermes formosanus]